MADAQKPLTPSAIKYLLTLLELCQKDAGARCMDIAEHDPQELLMPVDAVFSVHPPLIVTLGQAARLKNGAQVRNWQFRSGTYRVYAEDGEFLLLGRVENGLLTTIKSFFEVNTLAT